jgi:hypothetical protein
MVRAIACGAVGIAVVGSLLACGGVAPTAVTSPASPPAAPAPSGGASPKLGAIVATDRIASGGCSCDVPGTGMVFWDDGSNRIMNIDGADHDLKLVSDETKGKGRVTRYSGDGFEATLQWKLVDEGEGGANYDVKARVSREGGTALETQLGCGCSF